MREALGPQAAAALAGPTQPTVQQAKLNAADAQALDEFGWWSVALDGDTAVIGARQEDPDLGFGPLTEAGSAYVFVRSGMAVVGERLEDPDLGGGPLDLAGSAYVFVRSGATWSQEAKLNAADAEAFDQFGRSVALSGDRVLVGAFGEDPDLGGGPLDDAGSAYVFVSPTDLLYLPLILKN